MEQCPYGNECPQILTNKNSIELIAQKIDMQNQFMVDKMSTMADDVREMKNFLSEKLDEKIDERVKTALDTYQAKILRWIVCTLIGSGGLSALLTLLLK